MSEGSDAMDEVMEEVKKILEKLKSPESLKELGTKVIDMVRNRTRLGYGCSKDGKKEKLDALSDPYVKQRRNRKKKGTLSSLTSPAKSNLTLTGDMLKNMDYKVDKEQLVIEFSDEFSTNKATWNTDKERPFMNLTEQETKRVTELIKDEVAKLVKSIK